MLNTFACKTFFLFFSILFIFILKTTLLENIGEMLEDIGLGNEFLHKTPEVQALNANIDKLNYIKLRSFCTKKKMINQVKPQTT